MSPQEKTEFQQLKALVNALVRVENVSFIQNIQRKVDLGVTSGEETVATTILKAVNESGASSYDVAKVPDAKVPIVLTNGQIKYIGVYNS